MNVYLGYLGGFLTTVAFLPQAMRAFRTRSTSDLSLLAIVVFIVGLCCWTAYGVAINSTPMVFWNAVTLAINIGILVAKLRHG